MFRTDLCAGFRYAELLLLLLIIISITTTTIITNNICTVIIQCSFETFCQMNVWETSTPIL